MANKGTLCVESSHKTRGNKNDKVYETKPRDTMILWLA